MRSVLGVRSGRVRTGVGVLLWTHWVMALVLSGVSQWVLLWVHEPPCGFLVIGRL